MIDPWPFLSFGHGLAAPARGVRSSFYEADAPGRPGSASRLIRISPSDSTRDVIGFMTRGV